MQVLSFSQALEKSSIYSKRHLLLGNGFSIACIPTIFTYNSLFSKANFRDMPEVEKLFKALQTKDFELVINALDKSSSVLPSYLPSEGSTAVKMKAHADKLKLRLIETIAQNHPAMPSDIEDYKYEACAQFLSHFINNGCTVYTLNYDLLLYWTLMFAMDRKLITIDPLDGFGKDVDFMDGEAFISDYVTWQGDSKAHSQNIHYLHGALHVFDKGADIEKFTWSNTGLRLIDQSRDALTQGKFPLFVTEGESKKKMDKIIHCGYLFHSYKSFSASMKYGTKQSKSCLFTFGVSFGNNDDHILSKIPKGKVSALFIGLYGNPNSEDNKNIIASAELLKRKRKDESLQIEYYDAESANVWGNTLP